MNIPTLFSARLLKPLSLLVALLGLASHAATAQFVTTAPLQDGVITANEYPFNGAGAWYMGWDATYLYIAKTGDSNQKPIVVYLDVDPSLPVNGGSGANGSLIGRQDFNTEPRLPMRADARIYSQSSGAYAEFRTRDGGGTMNGGPVSNANPGDIRVNTNNSLTYEIRIRWAAIPGATGLPASFNWLGYQIDNSNNFVFNPTPTDNPSGINNQPTLEYYNTVSTTAATGTTNPFGRVSYAYPFFATTSNNNFGGINVYDFTMNSSGQQISRNNSNGANWNIAGTLVVGAGNLFFGASGPYGTTNVGNVRVTGGLLDGDNSTQPFNVTNDVSVTGGTFNLSRVLVLGGGGGDLKLGGNLTVNGGTFDTRDREVELNGGGAQTLANLAGPLNLTFLRVNNATGPLALGSNTNLSGTAVFAAGVLNTGANTLTLGTNALLNETNTSYILGRVQATQTVGAAGASSQSFNGIGLTVTPRNSSAAAGPTTVLRTTGTRLTGVNGNQSASRYFTVTPTTNTGLDFGLDFRYLPVELTAAQAAAQNTLLLFSSAGTTTPFAHLTGSTSAGNVVSRVDITDLARTFTIADAANPLPVELLSFAGQATDGSALLSWKTAQEVRFRAFEVQRQTGSGAWETLGMVPGRAATGASYSYRAALPAARTSYFRLHLLDQDGSGRYSQVVALAAAPAGTRAVFLSPVPATGQLSISTGHPEATAIRIYDVRGRLLLQAEAPTGAATVAVASLAPGLYVLETTSATSSQRTRFVKE